MSTLAGQNSSGCQPCVSSGNCSAPQAFFARSLHFTVSRHNLVFSSKAKRTPKGIYGDHLVALFSQVVWSISSNHLNFPSIPICLQLSKTPMLWLEFYLSTLWNTWLTAGVRASIGLPLSTLFLGICPILPAMHSLRTAVLHFCPIF